MGDGEVSNSFRERLERDMDSMQASLKQTNEVNKPPSPQESDGGNRDEGKNYRLGKIVDGVVSLGTAIINKWGGPSSKNNSSSTPAPITSIDELIETVD